MMEKKYQLVAWTKNITDRENARLYVVPSVELDLMEPLITEVSECQRLQKKDGGRVSPQLARRFIRVYEASARLDIFTGNFDYAIRFLLQAADYCIWEDDYNSPYYQFVAYCEEAISLARKYGFEYVLEEKRPKQTLKLFGDILLKISGKPGKMPEKILGESGKVRDNRLNSYKNDLFSPLLRDFGNLKSVYFMPCFCLKSVLIDKILQKTLVKRQNFAILQKNVI